MKRAVFLLICALLACFFTLTAFAAPDEISKMQDYIPPDIASELPEGTFDGDEFPSESFDFAYFTDLLKKALNTGVQNSALSQTYILGLTVAASILHKLSHSLKNRELSVVFETVSGLCIAIYVFTGIVKLFEKTSLYLTSLSSFASAITPFITMMFVIGGNITTAAVNETGLLVAVSVIEFVCSNLLYPIVSICAVMSIASVAAPKMRLGSVTRFIRGLFMTLIGLTLAAVSAIMTFQTSLSCAADTVGVRAVRFAASSFIPIVGSAISDAVRTVSGSIGYIRTSVGLIGVAVVVIITLPVFVNLMLTRIILAVGASVSDILDCEREAAVLKEAGGLVNFLTALVALSSVMFIYILTILIRCASAYGIH